MLIREALEELGVERVRMAMRSFPLTGGWENCFLACAYGEAWMLCADAYHQRGLDLDGQESAEDVAPMLGISPQAALAIVFAFDSDRDWLEREVTVWLAEHGSHPEPAVRVCAAEHEVSAQ